MFFSKKATDKSKTSKKSNYVFWVAILLALVFGGGAVFSALVDWQKYKPMIEAKAAEALGRTVSIRGKISGTLFPITKITAEDIVIANVPDGKAEQFLTLQELTVELSPMSLLSGQVDVLRIDLTAPKIYLEEYRDGGNNWQFGMAAPAAAKTAAPQSAQESAAPAWLNLHQLTITDGTIQFWQQAGGQTKSVAAIKAKASLNLAVRQADWDVAAIYAGQEIQSTGSITPAKDGMAVDAKITGGIGEFVFKGQLDQPAGGLAASGDWTAKLLDNALSASGKLHYADNELVLNAVAADFAQSKLQGEASLKFLDPLVVDTKWQIDQIDLALWQKAAQSLSGKLAAAMDMNAATPTLPADKEPKTNALPVRGNANIRVGKIKLPGGVEAQRVALIASTMDGQTVNIQRLGADLPGDSNADLTGAYRIAGGSFDGRLRLAIGNFPKLLEAVGVADNDWLRAQPARAELKTALVADAAHVELRDYTWRHGDLDSSGNASYNFTAHSFTHVGAWQHPNLQKLMAKNLPVNGQLAVKADIAGRLNDAGLDYTSLQGKIATALNNGTIDGVDLKRISLRLQSLNGWQDFADLLNQGKQGGTTKFDSASADWTMLRGVMETKNIALKSDVIQAGGQGQIQLAKQELDINTRVNFIDHPKVPPLGVRLFGAMAAPQQQFDTAAIQAYFAQRVINKVIEKNIDQEKLQQEIDKQKDKLLNKLFGQ
jgi:uncharacterized protein involved in outer membrane biogenesis